MTHGFLYFIAGVGAAFDFSQVPYKTPAFLSDGETDMMHLRKDWEVLCEDGRIAYSEFKCQYANHED